MIILPCKKCDYDIEVYRHTIQQYNFIHVDEDIEGDYIVKCPHCGAEYVMQFTAVIKSYRYWEA